RRHTRWPRDWSSDVCSSDLSMIRLLAFTGAVLLAEGGFTPARAQDPDDLKRGVARISLMNGEVSVRRGDTSDWVAGVINAPLLRSEERRVGKEGRVGCGRGG